MLCFKREVNYSVYLIEADLQVTDLAHHTGPFCCHLRTEDFSWKQSFIISHFLKQEAWPPTLNKSTWMTAKPLENKQYYIHIMKGKQTFIRSDLSPQFFCYYYPFLLLLKYWAEQEAAIPLKSSPHNHSDSWYHLAFLIHCAAACSVGHPLLRWPMRGWLKAPILTYAFARCSMYTAYSLLRRGVGPLRWD